MKIILKLKVACILALMFSCKENKEEVSLNQTSKPFKDLKEAALNNGDTISYHELSIAYMDSPNIPDFLSTAMEMANKHGFHEAYLDVYYCLTDYYYRKDFRNLDDLTEDKRSQAIKYLMEGMKKGDKECKKILGYYYLDGKYIEKNESLGKKLIQEGEE